MYIQQSMRNLSTTSKLDSQTKMHQTNESYQHKYALTAQTELTS